jgi:tetratricopeptide (TPR) repeat protein/Cdc6-like AAA superfamily ATPase
MKRLTPSTIIPPELYVIREADKQLRNVVNNMGRPGYVLVARQMGKTNLLLHAKRELENENNAYIYVDLSAPFATERECFRHIIDTAVETRSNIFGACRAAIEQQRNGSPPPSYKEHENELRTLLNAISGKLVIILDEIDSLTKGTFSDKIFAQIRSVYFSRVNYPQFNRLTYILSGVVEPNEIIKDKRISPFNIGEKIYLDDFTEAQFSDFLNRAGLSLNKDTADRVFYWANGNPRLTWDICSDLEEKVTTGFFLTPEEVDTSVRKLYLTDFTKAPIDHIREVVAAEDDLRNAVTVIKYGKGHTLADSVKNKLYLTGIIRSVVSGSKVVIKNKIIEAALSDQWLLDVSIKRKGLQRLAADRFSEHKYEEALSLFEQLVKSPDITETEKESAYWNMGLSAYHTGEFSKALTYLEKARWDKEATAQLYYHRSFYMGACYLHLGNVETSRARFVETMESTTKDTTYFSAMINLGATYATENRFARAIELYQQALHIAESSQLSLNDRARVKSAALYSLGKAYSDTRDSTKAETYFQEALDAATLNQRPAIILEMYQRMQVQGKKDELLSQCVNLIISNNLHPDPTEADGSLGLTPAVFYSVLRETYTVNRDLFDRLFAFAETLEELKNSGSSLLLKLAYLSAGSREYDTAIKMARDVATMPTPDLQIGTGAEFQSLRLLSFICKGSEKQHFQQKYVQCLKSGYEPETMDGADLQILTDVAERLIKSKKLKEALKHIELAKEYKPLIRKDQIPEFAAVLFYEMVALKRLNLNARLILASQETVAFIESLSGTATNPRLVSPEGLKNIEGFARENLGPKAGLFPAELEFHGTVTSSRRYGRNEKISVRYPDGKVVTAKFKKLQGDLAANRCELIDG